MKCLRGTQKARWIGCERPLGHLHHHVQSRRPAFEHRDDGADVTGKRRWLHVHEEHAATSPARSGHRAFKSGEVQFGEGERSPRPCVGEGRERSHAATV